MREIKFRGWFNNSEMLSGETLQRLLMISLDDGLLLGNQGVEGHDPSKERWDKIVFMQFTGLLDKYGTEIYEGDIVRQKTGRDYTETRIVEFRDGAFRFNDQLTPHASFVYANKDTEVIGNIYENPELGGLGNDN